MRMLVFDEPYSVTVRLEGSLNTDVAADLCTRLSVWQGLTSTKKVRLDLGDVSAIDDGGVKCLRQLHARGAEFPIVSSAVQQALTDIRHDAKEDLRNWLARIGIRLSRPQQRKAPSRFCRMMCAFLPTPLGRCACAR